MKNFNRRVFLKSLFGGGIVLGSGLVSVQTGFALDVLDYETLYASLYPKNRNEEAFLKDVADQIEKKTIPNKIAYASYQYAMKKRKSQRVVYFEKCLTILCSRAGIKIKLLPLD